MSISTRSMLWIGVATATSIIDVPICFADAATTGDTGSLGEVVVMAERLNAARAGIETQTGASEYVIDQSSIAASPGGSNVQFNQVLLQAPDVAQDSFGQLHIRGDHNDLQYRLNGIILPEGISVFGQTLDPRLVSSMSLITGALPAEYGLRTAGIIDITTRSGLLQPGGSASVYGGSHSTFEPSGWYGGSYGNLSFFVSADLLRNDLGIEAPDASSEPLHDHSTQLHGFGYFEDILDDGNRLSLVLGVSSEQFQIPNQHGVEPAGVGGIDGLGPCGNGAAFYDPPCQGPDLRVLQVNGHYASLSNDLNENQHELAQYAIFGWQHSAGMLNWQSSLSTRYTSLDFEPDWSGDLLYNGIAQNASKGDTALAWQTDGAYALDDSHTLRAGLYVQHDSSTSTTTSQVLPVSATIGADGNAAQTDDVPAVVLDNGSQTQWIESAYLQDEWKILASLTVNFGLRFDRYDAYSTGSQWSPRANLVWQLPTDTTLHAGYSRYFTPPPFELIASATFGRFADTTANPPGTNTLDTAPKAERSDYYDIGVQQKLLAQALTLGIDGYWRTSQNLIDEGQFGAPIVLTPFNYRYGQIGGIEFTGNYSVQNLSLYGNVAVQSAKGKDIESSQFNFASDELQYIANHDIHLDHEERVSASAGASYRLWTDTRVSIDMLFGTGLRQSLILGDGAEIPNGTHTPGYTQFNFGLTHDFKLAGGKLNARLDVINLLDKVYEIRSGSGIGVYAPQYAARRGLFVGLSKDF